jgi:hypothetical protein
MSKGSGLSRSERRRNARKERLRALVPRGGAVVGIDLGEEKQALALVDHDVRVLWRRRPGCGRTSWERRLTWRRGLRGRRGSPR